MAQETWLVVAVAAGFLLMGIAASPTRLGGPAASPDPRRARRERSFGELQTHLRHLEARLERCEAAVSGRREPGGAMELPGGPLPRSSGAPATIGEARQGRVGGAMLDDPAGPRLIAVPNLAAAHDRPAMHNGLSQRYAAIWDLADNGSSPDVIARRPVSRSDRSS